MSARLSHFSQFGPENVASCYTIPEKQRETNHLALKCYKPVLSLVTDRAFLRNVGHLVRCISYVWKKQNVSSWPAGVQPMVHCLTLFECSA